MNPLNVLVTGANGQLGNELRALREPTGSMRFTFVDVDEMDFTKENSIRSYFAGKKFDFIVNTAAYTDVERAEEETALAYAINASAVSVLSDICLRNAIGLIHVSTDYVLDGRGNKPVDENARPNPLSVYGKSKLEGETAVLSTLPGAFIIRTSWLYSSFGKNFVKTIARLAAERDHLDVIADQAGSPTYARDLAYAIVKILDAVHKGHSNVPGIYHYANEGVTSWYDLACAVVRHMDLACTVRPITTEDYPTRATRPCYSVLDKRKIKTTFDIAIPNWYDSMLSCLQELKGGN